MVQGEQSIMRFNKAVILVLLAILVGAAALPAAAQDNGPRTITVTGYGVSAGAPDVAYVSLGVQFVSANPSEAFSQANSAIATVRDAVVALGVAPEDIQTTGFNMWTNEGYDASGMPSGQRTYNAQNILTIVVRDVAIAGEVITTAVDAGANVINNLSFGIDDTAALAAEARIAAINDAQERPAQITGALGLTVGEVLTIDETPSGGVFPVARMDMAMGLGGGGASISEGQLSLSAQIIITFALNAGA
jgi:uncharacterized protein